MELSNIDKIVETVLKEIERGSEPIADTGKNPSPEEIAKVIDHTLLKPEATIEEITQLCKEAKKYFFASVCVNPFWVPISHKLLEQTSVKVCTVVGFPLGANTPEMKAFETHQTVEAGAQEIDMVMNIGGLKSGQYELVEKDIRGVVRAAGGKTVKVIFENCLLTEEEKVKACILSKRAGAHFVKTSTGFNKSGATVKDVVLMRKIVGPNMGVKAAGGIRTYQDICNMLRSGANRIGTSAGVAIVSEASIG
jgi:deoxyribose-phosphate aldolase